MQLLPGLGGYDEAEACKDTTKRRVQIAGINAPARIVGNIRTATNKNLV